MSEQVQLAQVDNRARELRDGRVSRAGLSWQLAQAEAQVRELQEAVIGAAKLVDAIGQWFIREDPDVPKWFEDAVLEIERTTRAALVPLTRKQTVAETLTLRRSEWLVDTLDLGQAVDLVADLHYAGGGSNTATFRHGLYRVGEWPLLPRGVAWWIPPTRNAAAATYPEGDWRRVLALSRFVLSPDVPKNGASFLLAASTKLIAKSGQWDCLVTYADEWQGHTGTMYKAAGWEYVGLTKPERIYVLRGRMTARKAGPTTRTHAEMLELGAECVGSFPKHKFRKLLVPANEETDRG